MSMSNDCHFVSDVPGICLLTGLAVTANAVSVVMLQPKTEKMHAIIERTAAFIAQHGVQMEIMMKAKQKDNACFSFLNYEDELNAYYKHVLHAIKHSKYIPASAAQKSADGKCFLFCFVMCGVNGSNYAVVLDSSCIKRQ